MYRRIQRSCAGEQLAITSHGSTVHFLSGLQKAVASSTASAMQPGQLLPLEQLPLRCIEHLSETKLIGAGFDGEVCPVLPLQELSHAIPLQSVMLLGNAPSGRKVLHLRF